MDGIAELVIAVIAVIVAIVSAVIAVGANARADTANRRAKEALDLQRHLDERAREFRDVQWAGQSHPTPEIDDQWLFRLHNVGLTDAEDVVLVLEWPNPELHRLGRIAAGRGAQIKSVEARIAWDADGVVPREPAYRVHWSSPLGQVQEVRVEGMQLF